MKQTRRPVGSLLIVSGIVLVASVAMTALSFVQLTTTSHEHGQVQNQITETTNQLQALRTEHADKLELHAQYTTGSEIKRVRRQWSTVLQEVENTFPSYSVLHTFSGSEDEKATLTVSTRSYEDIVSLIRVIKDKNPVFKDVFIPAISQTVSEDGQTYFTLPFELLFSDRPTS